LSSFPEQLFYTTQGQKAAKEKLLRWFFWATANLSIPSASWRWRSRFLKIRPTFRSDLPILPLRETLLNTFAQKSCSQNQISILGAYYSQRFPCPDPLNA